MAEIKQTIPFSFDEIYQSLVEKFAEKGYDSPYDGSDLAQLITGMSYIISMLNANTALNINETILTLAQKRKNIIQDARLLGYEPAQKISYVYEIELKILEDGDYSIPKYTVFEANGKKYYYTGEDLDLIGMTAGDSVFIEVKEGNLIKYDDDNQLIQIIADKQYIDIPYTDVEENGLEVLVTFFTPLGNVSTEKKYKKSDTFLLDTVDTLKNKFIRLENLDTGTPRIYFVFSGIGNPLPEGSIVKINVLQSSGSDGAMTSIPTCPIEKIEVQNYTLKIKGTEAESNESIKNNAPLLNNTANRVVTANDYKVISQKHSACKEAFVFGGEDEHPQKLGNVFFSFTPEKTIREFISNNEKTKWFLKYGPDDPDSYDSNNGNDNFIMNNYLLDSEIESPYPDTSGILNNIRELDLPALKYNIRHPLYIITDIKAKIAKYTLSSIHKKVRTDAFNVINEYFETLESFDTEFFKSNIIKRVDEYLTDITGIDVDVNFKIRLDSKSVVQENEDYPEYNIFLYLDTPYEGIYNEDGSLIISNLPNIDTDNFINNKNLHVDFTYTPDVNDINKKYIVFDIYLDNDKIGTYTIFNDNTTYIRVKFLLGNPIDLVDIPDTDLWNISSMKPLSVSLFNTPKYLNLKYPSENLRTIRNTIFKLNKVLIQ